MLLLGEMIARYAALMLLIRPLCLVQSFPVTPLVFTQKAHHHQQQQQQQQQQQSQPQSQSLPSGRRHHRGSSCAIISLQSAASSNTNRQNSDPEYSVPSNEFSRTIPPDRIRARSTSQQQQRYRGGGREYQMSISATGPECMALAQRFSLKAISSLEASVEIRATTSSGGSDNCSVEVEGSVVAAVTQTCVRTNEDFPVQLEFPLYAIVRPVAPTLATLGGFESINSNNKNENNNNNNARNNDKVPSNKNDSSSKQQKHRDRSVSYRTGSTLEDLDLLEMQRLLQEDIALESDDMSLSSLMEDEAIYPMGGPIDIGELVSQLFWLNLDPYPKKPGTDPIQRTISG